MSRKTKESLSVLNILGIIGMIVLVYYVSWAYWANTNPVNKELAKRSMIVSGYSDVVIGDYRFWGCASGDLIHFTYTAKGPTGIPTKGTVCAGLLTKEFTARH